MPVDPKKPRKILVVHGVQTGSNADQNQHETVKALVKARLAQLSIPFETEMYRYENINDKAMKPFKTLLGLIIESPVGSFLAKETLDLVGDVVISLEDGKPAQAIRAGLKKRIEQIYADGNPLYVLAHSLGSIYAFDVINELMRAPDTFKRESRTTWPVQGLITIGSPIGLHMFRKPRSKIAALGPGTKFFRWRNYWDRTDPVVSGSFYGKPREGYQNAETYLTADPNQGWTVRDRVVDTGTAWLMAHTAYWNLPILGDDLVDMIAN